MTDYAICRAKWIRNASVTLSLPALLLGACGDVPGEAPEGGHAEVRALTAAAQSAYAEDVYADFAAGSAGKVSFKLKVSSAGELSSLAGQSANQLLNVPSFWYTHVSVGPDIATITKEPRASASDEWAKALNVDEFEKGGHPLASGRYRVIEVQTTLAGSTTTHHALEGCWASQGYCFVVDPVVLNLESFVQTRRKLISDNWAPKPVFASPLESASAAVTEGADGFAAVNNDGSPLVAAKSKRHCWLASSRSSSVKKSFDAYSITYYNAFGWVAVVKHLAYQAAGVRCGVSRGKCLSYPFGESDASRCDSYWGWSCACDNTGLATGTSGSTSRVISETKCTHNFFGDASASVDILGKGASIKASWHLAGSSDGNGTTYTDSCLWR